ncbi:LysR substrate-binding domain-containing protein [Falsigemmobacter intermedius]|uniref:LysR family transcriptional regulator n=1 Tax=Falsigemmobacter intermedius TaxID=1553448 RepID=UPI003EFEBA45
MRLRSASSLTDLYVVSVVAKARNFTAAALELGLPPSSVSRRIAAVEDRLGVALFRRTTREVSLTDAGIAYSSMVEKILGELDEADLLVSRYAKMPEGTLRIETRPGLSAWLIAPLLPKFLAAYPTIRIDLRLTNEPMETLSPNIDLGIRYGLAAPSSLVTRKLTTTRQATYASPDYLAAFGTPETPLDLLSHNCVGFAYGDNDITWRYRKGDFDQSMTVQGSVRSNDVNTLRRAVVAGLGVNVAHEWMMENALREGKVVEILKDYEVTTMGTFDLHVSAIYSPAMKNVQKVRVFIDFLLNALRGHAAAAASAEAAALLAEPGTGGPNGPGA